MTARKKIAPNHTWQGRYSRIDEALSLIPELKVEPTERLRTQDLCDTSAVLYRLSYQAIWELFTLWVRNIPVEVNDANEYIKDHIFELRRKI